MLAWNKHLPGIVIVVAVLCSIGVAISSRYRIDNLEAENRLLKAEQDTTRMVGEHTAQRLAIELDSERELRALVLDSLEELKGELHGKVRSLTSLRIKLKQIADSLKADSVVSVDTLADGNVIFQFSRVEQVHPGYHIGFRPNVSLPALYGVNSNEITVEADIEVGFSPIGVHVVLTEDRKGVWESSVEVDSPLFESFGNLRTFTNPYKPGFFDKVKLGAGVGVLTTGGLYGRVGGGYSWAMISVIAGPSTQGIEVSATKSLSEIFGGSKR